MADDVGKPRFLVFDDDPELPRCAAEACDRPRRADEPFCPDHLARVDLTAWLEASGTQAKCDALWRLCCELATVDGYAYRRRLFDGTTVDSGH